MGLSIGIDGAMYDVDITGSYAVMSDGIHTTKWQSTDMWLKTKTGRFRLADVWNGQVFTIDKHGPVAVPVDGYLERWIEQYDDISARQMLEACKCSCCGKLM